MATGRNGTGNGHVRFVNKTEARRSFDRVARRLLGISGTEFLRRLDAGAYPDPDDDPNVLHLALLAPFGR